MKTLEAIKSIEDRLGNIADESIKTSLISYTQSLKAIQELLDSFNNPTQRQQKSGELEKYLDGRHSVLIQKISTFVRLKQNKTQQEINDLNILISTIIGDIKAMRVRYESEKRVLLEQQTKEREILIFLKEYGLFTESVNPLDFTGKDSTKINAETLSLITRIDKTGIRGGMLENTWRTLASYSKLDLLPGRQLGELNISHLNTLTGSSLNELFVDIKSQISHPSPDIFIGETKVLTVSGTGEELMRNKAIAINIMVRNLEKAIKTLRDFDIGNYLPNITSALQVIPGAETVVSYIPESIKEELKKWVNAFLLIGGLIFLLKLGFSYSFGIRGRYRRLVREHRALSQRVHTIEETPTSQNILDNERASRYLEAAEKSINLQEGREKISKLDRLKKFRFAVTQGELRGINLTQFSLMLQEIVETRPPRGNPLPKVPEISTGKGNKGLQLIEKGEKFLVQLEGVKSPQTSINVLSELTIPNELKPIIEKLWGDIHELEKYRSAYEIQQRYNSLLDEKKIAELEARKASIVEKGGDFTAIDSEISKLRKGNTTPVGSIEELNRQIGEVRARFTRILPGLNIDVNIRPLVSSIETTISNQISYLESSIGKAGIRFPSIKGLQTTDFGKFRIHFIEALKIAIKK